MLGVFDRSTAKQPVELLTPSVPRPQRIKTKEDMAHFYLSRNPDATFYKFSKGNFMAALSHEDDHPPQPRSIVEMEDICCIFFGSLENSKDLIEFYGLSRRANEAAIVFAAYKTLRDQASYPPDHVVKQFKGSYSFMLFDSKLSSLFLARDRLGGVEFHWGTAADGSLVCCDDSGVVSGVCGNCYTPFPQGCFFVNGYGLISFDEPHQMMKAMELRDDHGKVTSLVFQVYPPSRFENLDCPGNGDSLGMASSSYTNNNTNEEEDEELALRL